MALRFNISLEGRGGRKVEDRQAGEGAKLKLGYGIN